MSQFNQIIIRLSSDQIKALYNNLFSLEVRYMCRNWIEQQVNNGQCNVANDSQYDQHAFNFMANLVAELQKAIQRCAQTNNAFDILVAFEAKRAINRLSQNPNQFFKQFCDTMAKENELLVGIANSLQRPVHNELNRIDCLSQLRLLTLLLEKACGRHTDYVNQIINGLVQGDGAVLNQSCVLLHKCFQQSTCYLYEMHHNFEQRLKNWQQVQVTTGIGGEITKAKRMELDAIQQCFEGLAGCVKKIRSLIENIQTEYNRLRAQANWYYSFRTDFDDVTEMFKTLIKSCFVVENQPPQLIRTKSK